MEKYFQDIDTNNWSARTIILDIDGTITPDGGTFVDSSVAKKIQDLSSHNTIFLLSNKKLPERNIALSQKLGISYLDTPFKKPHKKIIDSLPENLKNDIVVIGDKVTTDGIFAKNIGGTFIKVKRLTSTTDSLIVKLSYIVDGCFSFFL